MISGVRDDLLSSRSGHRYASGMRIRQRARQRNVDCRCDLDHADWTSYPTIRDVAPKEVLIPHGVADALKHWADHQIKARD